MIDRALVLEEFERLATQLRVARAFLLDDRDRERIVDAREILNAVARSVTEFIDVEIDPALGWRPGHRVDMPEIRPR
jgi:hypothetical protein